MKYCKTIEHVFAELYSSFKTFGKSTRYAIIQTCLASKTEYKVVLHNGFPKHHFPISKGPSILSTIPINKVYSFASDAVSMLRKNCPCAILDGLVRVDVMEFKNKMVVNEIESLEATYYATHSQTNREFGTKSFLEEYWMSQLNANLQKCNL